MPSKSVSALNKPNEWWQNEKNYNKWMAKFFVPKVKEAQKKYGISVPYNFMPRPYQIDVIEAMMTKRFVVYCMHRRSGKDYMSVSMLLVKAMETVGNYIYLFPTAQQGRDVVWDGLDNDGHRFIDHIPKHLVKKNPRTNDYMINNTRMIITLVNGSTIRIGGSDRYDKTIVGTNFAGIIFSEYSLSDPKAWVYARPILAQNGGWAWFNGTPRGKNHFYKLIRGVLDTNVLQDDWYAIVRSNSDTGVMTKKELDAIRAEGQMSEQQIQQEFECAFEGCLDGVIYANQITDAQKEGRFGDYCYDKKLPVYVAFDLGASTTSGSKGDRTAMVFFQQRGDRPWVIDFYACRGMGVSHFKMIMDDFSAKYGYEYDAIFLPHDSKKKSVAVYDDQGYALEIQDMFRREFGSLRMEMVPRCSDINEDIEVVRSRFYKWYFYTGDPVDKTQKERLDYFYEAMEGYTYPEVDERERIAVKPLHNWCSDPMDAFRYAVKAQAFGWASEKARSWLADFDTEDNTCESDEDYMLI
jgi:hypothetical protein